MVGTELGTKTRNNSQVRIVDADIPPPKGTCSVATPCQSFVCRHGEAYFMALPLVVGDSAAVIANGTHLCVTPCSLVDRYMFWGNFCCFHLQGRMSEAKIWVRRKSYITRSVDVCRCPRSVPVFQTTVEFRLVTYQHDSFSRLPTLRSLTGKYWDPLTMYV